jgi:hypothetical protein
VHEPSCFVALPRGLLDTLYEQQPALPLPLELTPVRGDTASPSFFLGLGSWGSSAAADTEAGGTGPPLLVAWGGAAATGTALDVPAALADCHGLTDGTLVTLRVLPSLPAATMVEVRGPRLARETAEPPACSVATPCVCVAPLLDRDHDQRSPPGLRCCVNQMGHGKDIRAAPTQRSSVLSAERLLRWSRPARTSGS